MSEVWTEEAKRLAIASIQKWRGTPHHNRVCEVGVGVDCIKFVAAVLHEAGIIPSVNLGGYDTSAGMWGVSTALQDEILRCVTGEWVSAPYQFGDIAIFRTGTRSAHCGFMMGSEEVVHSLANRCVTVSPMAIWHRDIVGAVRLIQRGVRTIPRPN